MRKRPEEIRDAIPAPGEGKRGEGGYFGYLLRQAAGMYQNRLARELDDLAMTPPQFSVLTMIGAYDDVSGAEVARLTLLTPQTVSVIVGNLVRDGLVVRQAHATHGRIRHLALTAQGRSLLRVARERAQGLERALAADWPEDEQIVVRRWLAAVPGAMMRDSQSRR
ncbi:MarR family transcriptional regulator [Stakelama sediminis]|uniref:DNA-binding MarR family transcriptional regulator n=1 Tax=Stakelama sediminis TaxID=463200 RepID=A0A840YV04_9SPHN|nr:MarR family winged helix-turn-helix transcriptional regulator [Stakelama sediminis]MBB5717400.1 DNA-binding MarR family transcriptional regulator [Stakelama sediminis]